MLTTAKARHSRTAGRRRTGGRVTVGRTARKPTAPEPLRKRILDAARKIVFADGVDAISARNIAAEVGVSATAIYLHFESIEHLLHEIRMEGHALLTTYLRRPDEELNAIERICAMGVEYYRFGLEHPNYFQLMFHARIDKAQLGTLIASEGASLDVVCEAAKRGIERGEIRNGMDPLVIANVAWMSIHGLTSMVVSGHAATTAPGLEAQLLGGLMESMRAWLAPPASEARRKR